MSEIPISVSACLLGEQFRYDAGHNRNAFLLEELASHVRFVPVCPEVGSDSESRADDSIGAAGATMSLSSGWRA